MQWKELHFLFLFTLFLFHRAVYDDDEKFQTHKHSPTAGSMMCPTTVSSVGTGHNTVQTRSDGSDRFGSLWPSLHMDFREKVTSRWLRVLGDLCPQNSLLGDLWAGNPMCNIWNAASCTWPFGNVSLKVHVHEIRKICGLWAGIPCATIGAPLVASGLSLLG